MTIQIIIFLILYMKDLYSIIYLSSIIVSAILFLISFITKGSTSVGALISAYATFSFSVLMIMLNIIRRSLGFLEFILNVIPFILLLSILFILLYLTIKYYANISSGSVANYYTIFYWITSMLLLIQIGIVFYATSNEKFEKTSQISKVISSILYLMVVLSGINLIPMFNALTYYTTDGFQ